MNDKHIYTAESIDITMPIYSLIDYSNNYSGGYIRKFMAV